MFSDTNNLNAALRGFPLGGEALPVRAVVRGVAYYAQPIFDFLNIPEGISEKSRGATCFLLYAFTWSA